MYPKFGAQLISQQVQQIVLFVSVERRRVNPSGEFCSVRVVYAPSPIIKRNNEAEMIKLGLSIIEPMRRMTTSTQKLSAQRMARRASFSMFDSAALHLSESAREGNVCFLTMAMPMPLWVPEVLPQPHSWHSGRCTITVKKIILDGKAKIQGVYKLNQSPNERPTGEKEAKSFGVRMTL